MSRRVSLKEFQEGLAKRLKAAAGETAPTARLGFEAGGEHWLARLDHSGEVIQVPDVQRVGRRIEADVQAERALRQARLERCEVDATSIIRSNGGDLVASEGHRRRICSMGRVRDDDPSSHVAVGLVIGAHK